MRTISTGFGLCVLSGTIAVCFAAAHLGGETSAIAQPAVATPRSAMFVDCVTASNVWFSPVAHELYYSCPDIANLNQSIFSADVNADGKNECFLVGFWSIGVVGGGQPVSDPASILAETRVVPSGSGTAIVSVNVFPSAQQIGSSLLSQIPGLEYAALLTDDPNFVGWRDCDGDGDLDFVTRVLLGLPSGNGVTRLYWFENTGFQASPPPNPYDLDGDGGVNAGDISVLLLNFGG